MFKTLSAALIAASVLLAPMVSANAAQPATKAATTTTQPVKTVRKHKRHVVKHHKRGELVRHARHDRKHVAHKRHLKIVKAHKRAHVVATKTRAN